MIGTTNDEWHEVDAKVNRYSMSSVTSWICVGCAARPGQGALRALRG